MMKTIIIASAFGMIAGAAAAAQLKYFKGQTWVKPVGTSFSFVDQTLPAAKNQMIKFDKILSQCGAKLVYTRANDDRKLELDGIGSFKLDDNFYDGKVALQASSRTPTLCPNGINISIGDEDAVIRWTAQ